MVYGRTAGGEWVARVRGMRGAHARGRTLRQARQRLRAVLAKLVADPYAIDFAEDVKLSPPARRLLVKHWAARRRLDTQRRTSAEATREALEALLAQRINLKDASDLLGVPILKLQKIRSVAAGG